MAMPKRSAVSQPRDPPPASIEAITDLLVAHGVSMRRAKGLAMNDLRWFTLDEIQRTFDKVERPSIGFYPLAIKPSESDDTLWVVPSRSEMHKAVSDGGALCVNEKGELSIRASGYYALSHVWVEGLQRDIEHDGLALAKVQQIFAILSQADFSAEWIWIDTLAIPVIPPGNAGSVYIRDEMLVNDVINMMPTIYENAAATIVFDALLLQSESDDILDVATLLRCGNWMTRVWTYQEIKLARVAFFITRHSHLTLASVVTRLAELEKDEVFKDEYSKYHSMRLFYSTLEFKIGPSLADIALGCADREAGRAIDHVRAFFPTLRLKWEHGMTATEGMQQIYRSRKQDASRLAAFFGAPRLRASPSWLPSRLTALEGRVRSPLDWKLRTADGVWNVTKIDGLKHSFSHVKFQVFNFMIEHFPDILQCGVAIDEGPEVSAAIKTALKTRALVLLMQEMPELWDKKFAPSGLLAIKFDVPGANRLEVVVLCAVVVLHNPPPLTALRDVSIRQGSPYVEDDHENKFLSLYEQEFNPKAQARNQQDTPSEPLHWAVHQGNEVHTRGLLKLGYPAAGFNTEGWTPLHIAAARGDVGLCELLLRYAPTVDLPGANRRRDSPIHLAAANGHTEIVRMLLDRRAETICLNSWNKTPLMLAATGRHPDTVRKFIATGIDPDCTGGLEGNHTPLLLACWKTGNFECIQALLEGGANASIRLAYNHETPLHRAAIYGSEDVVKCLIQYGAMIEAKELEHGFTPLGYAIRAERMPCIKALLAAGADRNATFKNNYTPTHIAVLCKNWEILRLLLDGSSQVDVNVPSDAEGYTPLHLVLRWGAEGLTHLRLLLDFGADPTQKDPRGLLPFHYAIAYDCLEAVLPLACYFTQKEGLGADDRRKMIRDLGVWKKSPIPNTRAWFAAFKVWKPPWLETGSR